MFASRVRDLIVGAIAAATFVSAVARADYRVERIATGLNQPTYVAQAPGDTNFLYIVERVQPGNSSRLGRVLKYDVNTRSVSNVVLNFSTRTITGDATLGALAFSPNFQSDQTFYLAWNEGTAGQKGTSHVEQYTVGAGGAATLTRSILTYQSNDNGNNHTVDWIGFDPTATGDARNYLYITTGDGGPQASSATYVGKSQNLNEIYGKLLRVDISGGDAYAGTDKNFAIPTTNPIPAGGLGGLGEVFASGFRNPWRASVDRATGDLYIGDVGFNTNEEIDFLKAGSVGAGTPPDFGWPKREGTDQAPTSSGGAKGSSLDPIVNRVQPTDQSITGGYVYRGPIAELQGKYLFGDYVTGHIYTLDFDRDTNPNSFNGVNGGLADVTALFKSKTLDPTNAGYTSALITFGVQNLSSMGEDNAGNLYLIDFAGGSLGGGEIFRLTVPEPSTLVLAVLGALACLGARRRILG